MINTLEPAEFSNQGDRERPCGEEREMPPYWHGMAVLHWRTHQWQTFTRSTAPVD